ncbi:hypothetical protein GW17_00051747 [Ensete ventricosum]|nr:hypothetical protein GW17_00051747 [Ensete ventricosum]
MVIPPHPSTNASMDWSFFAFSLLAPVAHGCVALSSAQVKWPKEERKEVEARVIELSSQLAQTHIQVEEANQCIKEECREANSLASELALELNLTLHCVEQAKAQVKEAQDEATMVEDIAVKSIAEGEHQYEAHHRELKDAHWQLGKAIKESRQLKEWLSANSDELLDACLAIEEVRKAWEEEKSYASKREMRVVASYKEFVGFYYGL